MPAARVHEIRSSSCYCPTLGRIAGGVIVPYTVGSCGCAKKTDGPAPYCPGSLNRKPRFTTDRGSVVPVIVLPAFAGWLANACAPAQSQGEILARLGAIILFSWVKTAKRMRSIEVRSWKTPIGRVRRRTSRKRRSMALVVRTALRSAEGLVAKAGQKFVEIVAQTGDGGGIGLAPALGEAARGRARLHRRGGVHDLVQIGLDRLLIGFSDLVEDVPDLVRPAALDGDLVVDHGQGGDAALSRRRRRSCRGLRR